MNLKPANDVFILLKLHGAKDALFASPKFNFWMKDSTYYNDKVDEEAKLQM